LEPEHPAIRAWRQLASSQLDHEHLEVYQEKTWGSAVYRIVCSGGSDLDVIAKRSRQETAWIERTVYEEILPKLPLPALHYFGSVKESNGGFCWLFLEDVSHDREYRPQIREHRVAAAQWLGIMNTSAADLVEAIHLPKRGPKHYLDLLHSACNATLSNLTNPALKASDIRLLENILTQCDYLSAHWNQLASVCEEAPRTLVHGDFISKNVRLRYDRDAVVVLPFDWEKAGWGIPAEDISRVDIATYRLGVQNRWPKLTIRALRRLVSVGKIFRCLVFLDWIAPSLALGSVEQPIYDMRRIETWLAELIRAATWQV
jgi:hypothetical protein